MKIEDMVKGIYDCECGREHICPVDYVEIGSGVLTKLPGICEKYNKILMVSDENTWKVCGQEAYNQLGAKVEKNLIITSEGPVVIPDESTIAVIEAELTDDIDLIVGVGSGVINDLCKQVSFQHDLPYYIVATAPSMDGYVSTGSALILEGMKITLNARPPKAVIADTAVLKDAPMEMLQAGYGDIVGKYSCLNDWKLSTLINDEYFCQRVYDITYDAAKRVEQMADGIAARDEKTVGALMEALVVVGIAMSYVGNSRPASGSEHHLSHFFEITGILDNKEYFAHGIDVAFSAVETSKLREEIIAGTPARHEFDRSKWEQEINRIYSSSAKGIIALQDKLGWYEKDDSAVVMAKWEEIKKLLSEAPKAQEFIDMLAKVGLDYAEFEKLYGVEKIRDAVLYAKDLKDRYTVLWLYDMYF